MSWFNIALCQLGLHAKCYERMASFVYEEHEESRCVVCRRTFWKTVRRGVKK